MHCERRILIASLIWLTACGRSGLEPRPFELSGGAAVRIAVPEGPHQPGSVVPISVQNRGDIQYMWNPCFRALERRSGEGWTSVDDDPNRMCPLVGWMLDPGDRTDASTGLPSDLAAGEYRLRYGFSREAEDFYVTDEQVSNPFTVTPSEPSSFPGR